MNTRNIWKNTVALGKIGAIIIALLSVCGLGGIAAYFTGTTPTLPNTSPTPSGAPTALINFTLTADTGIERIRFTTAQTGSFNLTVLDLPFDFSLTTTDQVTLNVTAAAGYVFKAWFFTDGTLPQSTQPFILKAADHPNGTDLTAKFDPAPEPEPKSPY